jgi:hypothetical protein
MVLEVPYPIPHPHQSCLNLEQPEAFPAHMATTSWLIVACGDGGAVAGAVSSEGCILPIVWSRSMASIILWVGTLSTHAEAFP